MKEFLKDKEKEKFEDPPPMPEDIKELFLQRLREMAEQRADQLASRGTSEDDSNLPSAIADLKLEQITLPPTPGELAARSAAAATGQPGASDSAPKKTDAVAMPAIDVPAPPPPAATRPREVESQRKRGKKGTDEPGATP